jgi:hypothetical protein
MRTRILIAMLIPLAACTDDPAPTPVVQPASNAEPPVMVVGEYHFDEAVCDWDLWPDVYTKHQQAPELCRAPAQNLVLPAHMTSEAPEESPHGRKLYRLTVSSLAEYSQLNAAEPTIGFTAVKVAHTPRPDAPESPGDFVGLFIMKRIADATDPSTDNGWVYATTDADLRITSAGRIASCMACHADAPHGRLFGPLPGARRVTE